jgi:hypothetical protein
VFPDPVAGPRFPACPPERPAGRRDEPVVPGETVTGSLPGPRDVTAALRRHYPAAAITTRGTAEGLTVTVPAAVARYWGARRDPARAAALLAYDLRTPLAITGADDYRRRPGSPVLTGVHLAPCDGPLPPDPGAGSGIPAYTTVAQVIGDFPASRQVTSLIRLAIDADCRPHLDWTRSRHGRRYRVGLWHVDRQLLHGCIDVYEESGKFAEAWLQWGRGDERRTGDAAEVRIQLSSARDLHRGRHATRRSATGQPGVPPQGMRRRDRDLAGRARRKGE